MISAEILRTVLAGNGATTEFDTTFEVLDATHLRVVTIDANGNQTERDQGGGSNNYSVFFAAGYADYPAKLTVTYPASGAGVLATGETIVLLPSPPLVQNDDFDIQGGYNPDTLEHALDTIVRMCSALKNAAEHTIRVAESETLDLVLPDADARAGKYLTFDLNGDPTVTSAAVSTIGVSSFMLTLLDDTTAAAALATLGFTLSQSGVAAGPDITLIRDLGSGALGRVIFEGDDAAANATQYAILASSILDATNGSEDGELKVTTMVAGSLVDQVKFGNGTQFLTGTQIGSPTGGNLGAGTLNAASLSVNNAPIKPVVLGTEAATTSGTTVDITGIPAGVKRITFSLDGVSTNGTDELFLRLGEASGGISASGYVGRCVGLPNASAIAGLSRTTGMPLNTACVAADTYSGVVELRLIDAANNTWVASWVLQSSNATVTVYTGTAIKSLAGALDRVRLTTNTSTNTFDAGAINVTYE